MRLRAPATAVVELPAPKGPALRPRCLSVGGPRLRDLLHRPSRRQPAAQTRPDLRHGPWVRPPLTQVKAAVASALAAGAAGRIAPDNGPGTGRQGRPPRPQARPLRVVKHPGVRKRVVSLVTAAPLLGAPGTRPMAGHPAQIKDIGLYLAPDAALGVNPLCTLYRRFGPRPNGRTRDATGTKRTTASGGRGRGRTASRWTCSSCTSSSSLGYRGIAFRCYSTSKNYRKGGRPRFGRRTTTARASSRRSKARGS